MTPAGIEPATFRFVAQHPNHCATAVPLFHDEVTDIYRGINPSGCTMALGFFHLPGTVRPC